MPVVFRHKGYRFLFYSNEGDPREPVHIHALKDDLECKFWLWPEVSIAYNDGYSAKTLRELMDVVGHRRQFIESAWNDFFSPSN